MAIANEPTQQKTYAECDSASGTPPNEPSKFLHFNIYSHALSILIVSSLLSNFKNDRAQYVNLVSVSPHISPLNDPSSFYRLLT